MRLDSGPEATLEVMLTSYGCNTNPAAGTLCPRCGSEMDVHQPDANAPDRLLGTCPDCALWLVVEAEGRSFAWHLEIPSAAEAREMGVDSARKSTVLLV